MTNICCGAHIPLPMKVELTCSTEYISTCPIDACAGGRKIERAPPTMMLYRGRRGTVGWSAVPNRWNDIITTRQSSIYVGM